MNETTLEEDIPIPYKLILKNFGSHVNNLIEFGEPSENLFFRGTSGMGKSHIIRAIQLALGKKLSNDNEIFTYEDIGKKRIFKKVTEIQLIMKNSGKNHLQCYPKDAEITVGVQLHRKNPHKNHWYIINHEGTKENKSRKNIQAIFGRGDDPLIFIPQGKTRRFVEQPPAERYILVTKLIGIAETQAHAKSALEELEKARLNFERKTQEYETHQANLNALSERYQSYLKKLGIEEELIQLEKDFVCSKLHELFNKFHISETDLGNIYRNIQDNQIEVEELKKKNITVKNEIKKITQDNQSLKDEENAISDELKEKELQLYEWEKNILKYLKIIDLPKEQVKIQYKINDVQKKQGDLNEKMDKFRSEIHLGKIEINNLEKEIAGLKTGIFSLSKDHQKLKELFKQYSIPNEFLYEVVDFKEGEDSWRKIIESILNYDKKSILVPEEFQIQAEKINRENNFFVKLLSPRHSIANKRRPREELRNWRNILSPSPKILNKETVIDIMDLILGNTYFPEDPKELEQFRGFSPNSRFACLDNYIYTIYYQDRIRESAVNMIGKGAIEIEIKEKTSKLEQIRRNLKENNEKLKKLEQDQEKVKNVDNLLRLLHKEEKMKLLSENIENLSQRLNILRKELQDPKSMIESYLLSIEKNDEKIKELNLDIKKFNKEFQDIQKDLQKFSDEFNQFLLKWKIEVCKNQEELILDDFFIHYKEEDIDYKGITDKIQEFLREIPKLEHDSNSLKIKIEAKEDNLKNFSEFSKVDQENYNKAKEEAELFRNEIFEYNNEIEKCSEQFDRADLRLTEELEQYREKVNKIFRAAMNILNLDGSLEFERQGSSVNFELNIKVSNRIGGNFDLIEDSNFSGGEEQRTGVAFMIAVISQSRYPYVVWDEIDSDVGDDHREKIAEVIEKFFAGRKVIALSPQVLVPGYKKVFPLIAEVFKNDDGYSRLSYFRPKLEEGGAIKDLTKFT